MAAMGYRNQRVIPLGHGSGDRGADVVDRPYPVIVGTNQTETEITIDIDFHLNGALQEISGFEAADIQVTGSTTTVAPNVAVRTP